VTVGVDTYTDVHVAAVLDPTPQEPTRQRCSPHARGWSAAEGGLVSEAVALPARAGRVVRYLSPPRDRSDCAPRTRGGGPMLGGATGLNVGCSPHSRGWSAPLGHHPSSAAVLPARGGGPADHLELTAGLMCSSHAGESSADVNKLGELVLVLSARAGAVWS
jgi:hypothetical protein